MTVIIRNMIFLAVVATAGACSPVMEANRPDPVDITQFTPGQSKISVLSQVGNPVATTPNGDNSCDIYKMFTRGPNAVGKGAIAAGEIVADVFTLGLAEVVFTPVEAATRNSKHTVLFCYTSDNKLASVSVSEMSVDH